MTAFTVLEQKGQVHFIGIGGSGMSPLAEILYEKGYSVSGSDISASDNVLRLQAKGIKVYLTQQADNLSDAQLVVYTSAVRKDNPELSAAFNNGLPVLERADLLGWITRQYRHTISVSGTHGKTTTSSMISQICLQAHLDPTIFIGGRLPLIGANGRYGNSELMVCEACEFQDHYLKLSTETAVILNVDADHLDYFKTLDGVISSFQTFAKQAAGYVVYNADDANTRKAIADIPEKRLISFGLTSDAEFSAANVVIEKGYGKYTLLHRGQAVAEICLGVPGKHNVYNSLAAAAAAYINGASFEQIADGLYQFRGAGRRFEKLGEWNEITVIDDYAHHPTEIATTIRAAKEMGFRRVIAVFQPFTYSRTHLLLREFAEALSIADLVFVSDIMASREVNEWGVCSEQITEQMTNGTVISDFDGICDHVLSWAEKGDLVLTMGGGNVYLCARMIAEKLRTK